MPRKHGISANQVDGGSSTFADNGTASHEWSGAALIAGTDVEHYLGDKIALTALSTQWTKNALAFAKSTLTTFGAVPSAVCCSSNTMSISLRTLAKIKAAQPMR